MEVPAEMFDSIMVLLLMEPMFLQQEHMHMLMLHFADNPSYDAIVQVSDVELNHYKLLKRGS